METATSILDKIVPRDEAGKKIDYLEMKDAMELDSREGQFVKFDPSEDMEIELRDIDSDKLQIEFIISSFRRDDYGTRFDPRGMDISQYRRNPIVLYRHMRDDGIFTLPVARGLVESITIDKDGKIRMIAEFTPEDTFEFGYQVYKLVRDGFLNMASIGAQVMGEEIMEEENGTKTLVFTKWKLFEWSIVPIGANDDAVVSKREKSGSEEWQEHEDTVRDFVMQKREENEENEENKESEETEAKEDATEEEAQEEVKDDQSQREFSVSSVQRDGEKVSVEFAEVGSDASLPAMRMSFDLAETEDQKKYREYFEQAQPVMKLYRSLMQKLYRRVGLKPPADEAKAVRDVTDLILSPTTPQKEDKPVEARQLSPREFKDTTAELAVSIEQKRREALRSGKTLSQVDDLVAQWIEESVNSL